MRIDRSIFAGLDTLRMAAPLPSTGMRPGDRRSRVRGKGLDIADFRPYTPGDDLRLVDWNVFARLQAVLVKLFHEDRDISVLLVIDASASMGFGTPRKIDHAGELAACLAFLALRARERVRISVAAATRQASRMARGDHLGALLQIVDALDDVEPAGAADLPKTLAIELERGRTDHGLLITDLLVEEEVREATLRRLAAVSKRAILLHTLGDSELAPDLDDGILIDAETGEEVPVRAGKAAAERYQQGLAAWRASIEQRCSELGILYAPAFTSVPARTLIATDLRRRRVTEAARGGGR
ncbi:MAG: DUF58 domain-containing protein [Deltaproteobacteria bacterium]|nr:DUF58 domain-containing protein [Deltaproteobacteria bacterium]